MQLSRLQVDIAGKDVVQNDVLDEVGTVILFVIILLDAGKRNAQQLGVLLGIFISTLYKYSIVVLGAAAKGFVGVAVDDKGRS